MKNMFPKGMFGNDFPFDFAQGGKKGKKGKGGSEDKEDKNPQIMGAGSLDGGKYNSITISGSGEVEGDVEAKEISVAGSGEFAGDVKADEIDAAGSLEVSGSVEAESLEVSGSCDVDGRIQADSVDLGGFCEVGEDVEADTFDSKGGFDIRKGLKAREISIELNGQARTKKIECTKIRVRLGEGGSSHSSGKAGASASVRGGDASAGAAVRGGRAGAAAFAKGGDAIGIGNRGGDVVNNSWGASVHIGKSGKAGKAGKGGDDHILEADSIVGETVKLEATHAGLVRGKKVTIGPKCVIETVEYSESIEVDDEAKVKKQVKV